MEWAQELHKATEVRSRNPETESKNKLPPFFYGQQRVKPKTLNSVLFPDKKKQQQTGILCFSELRRAERGARQSAASAGPEEEAAGQRAAAARVHHLVSAQRGRPGEKPGSSHVL